MAVNVFQTSNNFSRRKNPVLSHTIRAGRGKRPSPIRVSALARASTLGAKPPPPLFHSLHRRPNLRPGRRFPQHRAPRVADPLPPRNRSRFRPEPPSIRWVPSIPILSFPPRLLFLIRARADGPWFFTISLALSPVAVDLIILCR
jgi:hypothetical protein